MVITRTNMWKKELINRARSQRNNMTLAEIILWSRLRMKQIDGYKFRRQQPIFNYIVDFYCHEHKLVIEVDGEIHSTSEMKKQDRKRENIMKLNGYNVIRFTNDEVLSNINSVINSIKITINSLNINSSPSQGDHRGSSSSPSQRDHKASINSILSPSQGNHKPSINSSSSPSQGDHRGSPYLTTVVPIGSIPLGGTHPIRLQSMTNTDTLDTEASVAQCIRIIEAGADYVRLTTQGIKEAENLAVIKTQLRKAGFENPLIADVHFNPAVAEVAARIVEKVRINPGNYTDKRASFQKVGLSEKEYKEELERIHSRILPLINICRTNGTAIRIGVNHGSLSDRIMTRYGNTPEGMVWSAIEFIRIMKAENFNNLVLSMKSSDTDVMIASTRLLVKMMEEEGVAFPLHLGVTEAGEGEDGRVRSAAGIGTLLAEGIGDTIRVSLSEDPEKEIPVAKKIVQYLPRTISVSHPSENITYAHFPEKQTPFLNITGPLVMTDLTTYREIYKEAFTDAGFRKEIESGNLVKTDNTADIMLAGYCPAYVPDGIKLVLPYKIWTKNKNNQNYFPLYSYNSYAETSDKSEILNFILEFGDTPPEKFKEVDKQKTIIVFRYDPGKDMFAADRFLNGLSATGEKYSVILNPEFMENNIEDLQIKASAVIGRFVNAKNICGICISNRGKINQDKVTALSFSILQCTGARITRTRYISCPTCGRTKFNLQEAVKKVKEATGHLKGLKIAVMGCIVNGPGEMAGSDWGYVGAGAGKVTIYKGSVAVLKNVPEEEAVEKFLKLIEADQK